MISPEPRATVYLYVPFKANEDESASSSADRPADNAPLIKMAERWETRALLKDKYILQEKDIKIIVHGQNTFPELKPTDTIYVVAHGIDTSTAVCNVGMNDIQAECILKQEEVVARMLKDGAFAADISQIKLFYCDEAGNAEPRAREFMMAAMPHIQGHCNISYYPDVQTMLPQVDQGGERKVEKKALKSIDALTDHEWIHVIKGMSKEHLIMMMSSLSKQQLQSIAMKVMPALSKDPEARTIVMDTIEASQETPPSQSFSLSQPKFKVMVPVKGHKRTMLIQRTPPEGPSTEGPRGEPDSSETEPRGKPPTRRQ